MHTFIQVAERKRRIKKVQLDVVFSPHVIWHLSIDFPGIIICANEYNIRFPVNFSAFIHLARHEFLWMKLKKTSFYIFLEYFFQHGN